MKKNKKLISILLTSLMIFSIVVTSFVPTLSSHAQENMDLVSRFGISTDDILNQDDFELSNEYINGLRPYVTKNSTEYITCVDCVENNSFDFSNLTLDEVQATWASFNNIVVSVNGLAYQSYLIPDGSFIVYENSSFTICMPHDLVPMDNYVRLPSFRYENGSCDITTSTFGPSQNLRTIDDKQYYYYSLSQYYMVATSIISNLPIYYTDGSTITSIIGASDINYSKLNGGKDNSNIINHLTLRDGTKFYISNSSFDNGNLYLYPILDTTQMGKNESLDEYYFRLVGTVSTNNFYNTVASFHCLAPNGNKITNYFPMSGGSYNGYDFTLSSSDGYYYDIPVKDVNNGSYVMPLNTLNDLFMSNTDYSYHNLAYAYDTAYDGTTAWDTTKNVISSLSVSGVSFDASKITNGQADVVPNKVLYHIDLYIVKKNIQTDEESIGDVQAYIDGDICTGGLFGENVNTSSDDDVKNALGTNYIPSGYNSVGGNTNYKDTYNNVGGSGGSASADNNSSNSTTGGSANIGDGAIVINNNPTFNNDVSSSSASSSSGFGGFLSTLITLIANGKTSSVETISSISGTTGYTNLVNTYLSTVPSSLWNVIIVTMTALLGISIIAFIIGLLFKIFF